MVTVFEPIFHRAYINGAANMIHVRKCIVNMISLERMALVVQRCAGFFTLGFAEMFVVNTLAMSATRIGKYVTERWVYEIHREAV